MPGLPLVQASSAAWASVGSMWSSGFDSGWILDQSIGATGGFTVNCTPSSSSFSFFSTGDATAFYLPGRLVRAVQAGTTTYCQVLSSSSGPAGSTTSTQITVGNFVNSSGLSTGAFTSVAASLSFPSTGGGAGNMPNEWGTIQMIHLWGL